MSSFLMNQQQSSRISLLRSHFFRHIGHENSFRNHSSMHSRWKQCLHGVVRTSSSLSNSIRQIGQVSLAASHSEAGPLGSRGLRCRGEMMGIPQRAVGMNRSRLLRLYLCMERAKFSQGLARRWRRCRERARRWKSWRDCRSMVLAVYLRLRQVMKETRRAMSTKEAKRMAKVPMKEGCRYISQAICRETVCVLGAAASTCKEAASPCCCKLQQVLRYWSLSSSSITRSPTTILWKDSSLRRFTLIQCVEKDVHSPWPSVILAVSKREGTSRRDPSLLSVSMQKRALLLEGLWSMQMLKVILQQLTSRGTKQKQLQLVVSEERLAYPSSLVAGRWHLSPMYSGGHSHLASARAGPQVPPLRQWQGGGSGAEWAARRRRARRRGRMGIILQLEGIIDSVTVKVLGQQFYCCKVLPISCSALPLLPHLVVPPRLRLPLPPPLLLLPSKVAQLPLPPLFLLGLSNEHVPIDRARTSALGQASDRYDGPQQAQNPPDNAGHQHDVAATAAALVLGHAVVVRTVGEAAVPIGVGLGPLLADVGAVPPGFQRVGDDEGDGGGEADEAHDEKFYIFNHAIQADIAWISNRNYYLMKFLFSTSKVLARPVYIVAAKRTAIGAFNGKLSSFTAPELGGFAIRGALDSINLDPKEVDEVILGNVLGAGIGQAPARQASLKGGIGIEVPCTTINKVCSSGLKSLVYGAQSIALGESELVVAGGFESMSRAPHLLLNARKGLGYGDQKLVDVIAHDGLTDSFNKFSMGLCAEKTASDFKVTREAQDEFCKGSYRKHIEAAKKGLLADEIVPIKIKEKGKEEEVIAEDEEAKRYKEDKISQIPPAFTKTGTITAANASKINDGAVSVILASEEKLKKLGLKPLARIVGYADAEIEPIDFSIAPNYSTKKVLARTGLNINQIDYFQYNEAFSVVCIANRALLDIPADKINVHGGAVAMGHPIGASGARIVQSLLTIFKSRGGKYGLAGICNGGGGSTAMIIENLQ